jgi:hypothetical protein
MTSEQQHPSFKEHRPSITPEARKKFVVLVVLASIIIFLIWIASIPLNIARAREESQSPVGTLRLLQQDISNAFTELKKNNDSSPSQ